ncbi:MAG: Arc family DNA-binding protein [Rhodoferax sp.]|nr:Arc family DNA-binding protein [Rhodoferax sp.]
MSNISIKDVPEQWAECLRQRAARNHRSLQGELMAIIERAVQESAPPAAELGQSPSGRDGMGVVVGYGAGGHPIIRRGWKTVEQVAAELKAKYPEPFTEGPLGADIIREDRDSR